MLKSRGIAQAQFAEDGTAVLGTILNFWNPKTPGYGYYTGYYAGYYHYYGNGDGGRRKGGPSDGGSDSDVSPDSKNKKWTPRVEVDGDAERLRRRQRYASMET